MIGVAIAAVKRPSSLAGPGETHHRGSPLSNLGCDQKNAISVEDYAGPVRLDGEPVVIDLDKYVDLDDDDDVIFVKCENETRKSDCKRAVRGFIPDDPVIEIGESRGFIPDDPVIEIGESSDPKSFCAICMEPRPVLETFSMSGCSHTFCEDCTRQYLAVKIQENAGRIFCPQPGCKDGILEPERCHSILPPEVFERWCRVLCESLILGSTQFYCPFKNCSAPLLIESWQMINESECPHCFRLFCAQCRVPWHPDLSCGEYQQLGKDERANEDIMLRNLAKSKMWQRCPKCKFYVERIDGCKAMRCRCGHQFCYTCGTQMVRDHYCGKCRS